MKTIIAAIGVIAAFTMATPVQAQKYPTHSVRIVVPFPAGSAPDQAARIVGQELKTLLGQTVVVDNKPGAQGAIGAAEVAKSPADGYTLLFTTNTTQAANVSLFKKLPYDPVKDFTPVVRIAGTSLMLVVKPDFPTNNMQEFIGYARANPDKLSAGYGSAATQVAIGMLQTQGKVSVLSVPYKGVPQTAVEVMGGQISFAFLDSANGVAQTRGGKLKAVGVTSVARNRLAPEVPTFAEALPGFELSTWYGIVAPAGTPREIVRQLYEATHKGITRPEVSERFVNLGLDMMLQPPEEFDTFIRSEIINWASRIKDAGIEPQ